jgi:hypothetical protein
MWTKSGRKYAPHRCWRLSRGIIPTKSKLVERATKCWTETATCPARSSRIADKERTLIGQISLLYRRCVAFSCEAKRVDRPSVICDPARGPPLPPRTQSFQVAMGDLRCTHKEVNGTRWRRQQSSWVPTMTNSAHPNEHFMSLRVLDHVGQDSSRGREME